MSIVAIFLVSGIVFLALSAHPFVTYPLSLFLAPKLPPLRIGSREDGDRPTVAICMSALNEERVIVAKMESLLGMAKAYGPATIHVYADCPADATIALLAPYADRVDLVIGEARRGKTFGLNTLVARSSSELLLFTDANVVHDDSALTGLAASFVDPTVGIVSARLNYVNRSESATSAMGAFYWSIEEAIKRIESETVGIIGVDGAMFAARRSLYRPAPPSLIDDFYVSLSVLIAGARIVSADGVIVEERSAVSASEEYRRKVRIACQSLNVHRALRKELPQMPRMSLYGYVSHRVMKWLSPFFLLFSGLFLFAAIGAAWGWGIAALIMFGGIAALFLGDRLRIKPAALLLTAIFSLAGVGLGVLQSIFTARTYTVWSPANSVRGPAETSAAIQNDETVRTLD
jgi:cellulose synthase/poly-beta-1,6-N-acetylglucosamine synthase-like glycosyltransferase